MIIDTTVLQEAVKRVIPFVSQKTTVPVAMHFLLDSRAGTLRIRGTSFEYSCMWDTHVETDEEFFITVPARLFYGDVLGIKSETTELSIDNHELAVRTERHKANIKTLDGNMFPQSIYSQEFMDVDPRLTQSLEMCAVAINPKLKLEAMSGVFLRTTCQQVELYATDRFRLTKRVLPFDYEDEMSAIIPRLSCTTIAKSAHKAESMQLSVDFGSVAIKTPDAIYTSQLLAGEYPHVWKIFGRSRAGYRTITLNAKDLYDALKRLNVYTPKADAYVFVIAEDSQLIIKASANDTSIGEISIDCAVGGQVKVALNAMYLRDFLRIIGSEDVEIQSGKSNEPVYITGIEGFDYMLAPMSIR